ncbi:MAG: ABC transporter permease, partial [Chloroflexota bacterium]|nr:ABC transporter permease [Chloroflexota bacterium]
MRRTSIVARRVLTQLSHDRRLLGLSIVAPLVIVYLLKLFFDTMPPGFFVARYAVPVAAFLVHFLAFLLCAIVLVQERTAGTMERMFINGYRRTELIGGYLLGYLGLATLQAAVALAEVLFLFNLSYSAGTLVTLFVVVWLLAIASVMLGIFLSTFARHEGQVFPFVPMVIVPSVFLSGLLVDPGRLPTWADWLGRVLPLRYANNVIQEMILPEGSLSRVWPNLLVLAGYSL